MLNPKAFAHAVTLITAVFYLACWLLSVAVPDLIFAIARSWLHSINLESVRSVSGMPIETVVLGLVSITLLTWVTTYATIWLYNRLGK